jgi:hypothetical protein
MNFGPLDVGHLIPLSVGHKDKPTEIETIYIRQVMALSDFWYDRPDKDKESDT